jgi:hypothetical protein
MSVLAQRNNLAASFLQVGQYTDAYHELRRLLNDLTQKLKVTGSFGPPCTLDTKNYDIQPMFFPCPQGDSCFFDAPFLLRASVDMEETVTENSCVCAVALFNMGLACQSLAEQGNRSLAIKRRWLSQARNFYTKSYLISKTLYLPLLDTASCNNLMELSFQDADMDNVRYWKGQFESCVGDVVMSMPTDVWAHFSIVQVYFLPSLHCAQAA